MKELDLRAAATKRGATTYESLRVCCYCGSTKRYVSSSNCASCTNKRWNKKNSDKMYASAERWRKNNPGASIALRVAYRARKLRALPKWADLDKIRAIYEEAARLGMTVDHIYPLKGENVCGLHVHNNLQLLSKSDNSTKGNRTSI